MTFLVNICKKALKLTKDESVNTFNLYLDNIWWGAIYYFCIYLRDMLENRLLDIFYKFINLLEYKMRDREAQLTEIYLHGLVLW